MFRQNSIIFTDSLHQYLKVTTYNTIRVIFQYLCSRYCV